MGSIIRNGRYTASLDGRDGVVVFLIGMRVNRLLAVRSWLPVALGMPRMLTELFKRPELGLLDARTYVSGRVVAVVQYWNSVEQLNAYARAGDRQHLPAWRRFNQRVRDNGAVGIWHETYRVAPGAFEAVYGNMPPFGLALATGGPLPIGAVGQSAARRMDATVPDVPAVAPY